MAEKRFGGCEQKMDKEDKEYIESVLKMHMRRKRRDALALSIDIIAIKKMSK